MVLLKPLQFHRHAPPDLGIFSTVKHAALLVGPDFRAQTARSGGGGAHECFLLHDL